MLRLGDLTELAPHAPTRWHPWPVHLDPDLRSQPRTYGDNCRRAGRAYSLRRAQPGDLILFLARLSGPTHPAAFHLVGALSVADVAPDLTTDPGPGWWDANAHIRRARAHGIWDSFWVFLGSPQSRLFERARPFGRRQAEAAFGPDWNWRPNRSELQTIGSYTRAVRRLTGEGEDVLRSLAE
jgi:hypothetical protein